MLFVDEFCGILVYIKFGADVTSQYVDTVGRNKKQKSAARRSFGRP